MNKVQVGVSTIVGYVTLAVGLVPIAVKTVEEGRVAFGGPEKWLAIGGIVMGGITACGRYLQAHALASKSSATKAK